MHPVCAPLAAEVVQLVCWFGSVTFGQQAASSAHCEVVPPMSGDVFAEHLLAQLVVEQVPAVD
jgi:hypothetical protein